MPKGKPTKLASLVKYYWGRAGSPDWTLDDIFKQAVMADKELEKRERRGEIIMTSALEFRKRRISNKEEDRKWMRNYYIGSGWNKYPFHPNFKG